MNTKTPTPTTAAELLAEWNQKSWTESKFSNHQDWRERRQSIAARLDEMCEDAGISIKDGRFCYQDIDFDAAQDDEDGSVLGMCDIVISDLNAREQQALQEWLLIKESI